MVTLSGGNGDDDSDFLFIFVCFSLVLFLLCFLSSFFFFFFSFCYFPDQTTLFLNKKKHLECALKRVLFNLVLGFLIFNFYLFSPIFSQFHS